MAPSPESGADFQSRWPQASQNSLGGISRLPQRPHLMAVSRPSRAVSKNVLSVIAVSVTAEQAHAHGGGAAAEPSTQIARLWRRATSSEARITAAPPSVKGQQS